MKDAVIDLQVRQLRDEVEPNLPDEPAGRREAQLRRGPEALDGNGPTVDGQACCVQPEGYFPPVPEPLNPSLVLQSAVV